MASYSHRTEVSGSSDSSEDEATLKRPTRQNSFFQEGNVSSSLSNNENQFSVMLNDSYLPEHSDESKDISTSFEGSSLQKTRDNHSDSNSSSSSSSKKRRLINSRVMQSARQSMKSVSSGSANSTPLVGVHSDSDKFSSTNTSRDTVNTNALMETRRNTNNTTPLNSSRAENYDPSNLSHSGNDAIQLQESRRNVSQTTKRSSKTISTSQLLSSSDNPLDDIISEGDESEASMHDKNRTSSFYLAPEAPEIVDDEQNIIEDYDYLEGAPAIEEAVELFKMEARRANMLELSSPKGKDLHRRQTSLLSSILVPPPKTAGSRPYPISSNKAERSSTMIPALRKVSGSSTPKLKQSPFTNQEDTQADAEEVPNTATLPATVTSLPRRDSTEDYDSATYRYIQQSRKRINELNDIARNDIERNVPIQRVDVSSLSSQESRVSIWSHFNDLFSVTRLIFLFIICLLIPPLFFFIGFGYVTGFDDERLMKFILHSQYRYDLMPGFIWAIDLTWLRRTFIISGLLEMLLLFACVAIGFGVGLS